MMSGSTSQPTIEAGRTAAKPARRSIVIVLGMHRSGTSLCSHILSALGIDMADDVGRGTGNEDGHWERWELVSLHDQLLASLNRDYGGVGDYHPQHDLPLPKGWRAEPKTRAIGRDIETFLKRRMLPDEPFGFKDPRSCRLLPLWFEICDRLALEPKFVICVRHPAQVAASLARRDRIPERAGEYRWLVYNAAIFRDIRNDSIVIDYESWFSAPQRTVERLARFVKPDAPPVLRPDVLELIDANLNHGGSVKGRTSGRMATRLFDEIRALEAPDASRQELDRILDRFEEFQEMNAFEDAILAAQARLASDRLALQEAVAARDEVAREAETLRQEVSRLAGELTQGRIDGDLSRQAELSLRDDVEAHRQEVARLSRQCDERLGERDAARRIASAHREEIERALAALRAVRTNMTHLGDEASDGSVAASSLPALCDDLAKLVGAASLQASAKADRIRRLEQALAGKSAAPLTSLDRLETLTRKIAALQAALRFKDVQIAKLSRLA